MTTTSAPTRSGTSKALPASQALALLSGTALVADTVTITVINRSFDPLDSILFLTGFVCMLAAGAALTISLTAARSGLSRVLVAIAMFLGMAVVLGAVATAFDAFGRHTFSASNKGLHGEWSFFSIGLCMLALAFAVNRRLGDAHPE